MADNENGRKKGWKKYFKVANTGGQLSPISGQNQFGLPNYDRQRGGDFTGGTPNDFAFRNYASRLPEVYSGHPNRIERYNQYENMDADSEVNACLDIIAEFSTQINDDNKTPFDINFTDKPTDHEIEIVKKQLMQWTKLNKFDQRMFKLFRNTIKYGDQVFLRDPETFEMFWIDNVKVARVIVNESEGKRPEQYIIRDINPNFQNMSVASKTTSDYYVSRATGSVGQNNYTAPSGAAGGGGGQGGVGNSRFTQAMNESCIDARHIVHLTLNEGLDYFWPFGQSILENIFKVYKQKELLEDSVLIYRVQRAPERRLFKIDVGNMPSHMAMAFVERVKNEMHQRRIPTTTGGGANMMDASYNPLSINEDYFFPQTSDGRGSSVEVLPGGENLGEIDDLKYFNNKMARGLRVPSSYLPTGPDDSNLAMNDGRVGTALIQEYRFNQYCMRLQRLIMQKLDDEFKMFLRWRGFNIDAGLFSISLCEPQNFASYRQAEMDTTRITAFSQLESLPYMSKRFMMKRYLGLTDEEIMENEQQWREEREEPELETTQGQDLRSIGITPAGLETDIQAGQDLAGADIMGDEAGTPPVPSVAPGGTSPGAGAPAAGAPGVPGV